MLAIRLRFAIFPSPLGLRSGGQRQRIAAGRVRACIACVLVIGVSLFTLPGCGGPSQEDTAKQDEQGKKANEEAMSRMLKEQGKPGVQPGADGQ